MLQRPPHREDPSEEEGLEFDGTHTDQLVDTYRFRLVASSEYLNGGVGFDDRGQAQWKWITEVGDIDDSGTFDQLKALENPELSLEEPEAPRHRNHQEKRATTPTPPAFSRNRKPAASARTCSVCGVPHVSRHRSNLHALNATSSTH